MKITSALSIAGIAVAAISGILYLVESRKDVTDYYTYFGTVTEKSEYLYPSKITLATFGVSPEPVLHLDFVNDLYCAPIDSNRQPMKIASRFVVTRDFSFTNTLPDSINTRAASNGGLSQMDTDAIRETGNVYVTWAMDDLKPNTSSVCFVESSITGYTAIFKIPMKHKHRGNEFLYTYPDE